MRTFLRYACLMPPYFLAPEGGAGGGAGGAGDGGAGGAGGGAGDGGTGGGAPYRPQGLADDFYGKSDKETIDKLFKGYGEANGRVEGFRREMSERGIVPEKHDDYKFDLSDKAKPVIQIGNDDKLMPKIRELAQKHKMPDKMFSGFMTEFFDTVVDLGVIEKPVDPNDIYKALGKGKGADDASQITAGTQRLNQAQQFINAFTEKDGFTPEMKSELGLLTTSAAGVAIIEKLQGMGLKPSVNPGGQGGGQGAATHDEVKARQADPRNDRNSAKYEPAYAAETLKKYKELFPN